MVVQSGRHGRCTRRLLLVHSLRCLPVACGSLISRSLQNAGVARHSGILIGCENALGCHV